MSQSADTATAPVGLPTSPFHRKWGSHDASRGERALDWFETIIWHDGRICSECFTRLKHSATYVHDDWGNTTTESWRTDEATLAEDHIEPPATVANVQPMPRQRTTCLECGSIRGLAQSDALTKQAAVDRVPALVDRLREAGYAVDVQTVYNTVRTLKSQPDRTDDDKHIFAAAAARGVEQA